MLDMGKTEKWTLSKQEFNLILVLAALVCLLLEIILYGQPGSLAVINFVQSKCVCFSEIPNVLGLAIKVVSCIEIFCLLEGLLLELHVHCNYHSKCQKYSPTESSKAYDKAVSRKQGVVFDPKQVVEKIRADITGARKVLLSKDEYIKHYLEVSPLQDLDQ